MPSIEQFLTLEQWGTPLAKIGDYVYVYIFNGKFQKVNVNTKNISTIDSYYANTCEGAVHDFINNRLIGFGYYNPSGTMKSALFIVNLSNDSVTRITDNSLGMEFRSGALDYVNRRLLFGEVWGGIRLVPLDYVDDVSKWTNITPNISVYLWLKIAIFGDKAYAFVVLSNAEYTSEIVYSNIDSLSTWSVLDTSTVAFSGGLDVSDKMLAYSFVNSDGNICVKYTYDGENFTSVIVGSASGCTYLTLKIVGKYIFVFANKQSSEVTDVYIIDVSTNNVYSLGSISGITNWFTPVFDMQKTVYTITSHSYMYAVKFDSGRKLAMSVSDSNPYPGNSVQISATLKDESDSPIEGETIYFYLVKGSHPNDGFYGEEIGNAQTNEDGVATIEYQIPAGASGSLWFRALYKG